MFRGILKSVGTMTATITNATVMTAHATVVIAIATTRITRTITGRNDVRTVDGKETTRGRAREWRREADRPRECSSCDRGGNRDRRHSPNRDPHHDYSPQLLSDQFDAKRFGR